MKADKAARSLTTIRYLPRSKAVGASAKTLIVIVALLVLATAGYAKEDPPRVQLAILLDASGSMSGLINQARTQLWKIVNEFATAERDGMRPMLEVALYEYGKSSLSAEDGYIRRILPLTTDLDSVSEELFALTTNGGDEYCGWVIQDAVEDLAWSSFDDDFKAIFIAGNEPFSQGSVDFRTSCQASIDNAVIVNTIHCGAYEAGISGGWKDGALLADGRYLNIDQDRALVHINAPQDEEIARLSAELNNTYVPYGSAGIASAVRQEEQDANAFTAAPEAAVERAVFKSSGHYKNAGWDLVDAVREGHVDVGELDEDALPENMQEMTPEEQEAYLNASSQKRSEIQAQISQLNIERKAFVAEKMKETGLEEANTLDAAMIEAIRDQATARQFELDEN